MLEGSTPIVGDPIGSAGAEAVRMFNAGQSPTAPAAPTGAAPNPIPAAAPAPAPAAAVPAPQTTISVPASSPIDELLKGLEGVAPGTKAPEPDAPTGLEGTPFKTPADQTKAYKELLAYTTKVNQENIRLSTISGKSNDIEGTATIIGEKIAAALAGQNTQASEAAAIAALAELKETDPEAYNREVMLQALDKTNTQIAAIAQRVDALGSSVAERTEMDSLEAAAIAAEVPLDFFSVLAATDQFRQMPVAQASASIKAVYDTAVKTGVDTRIAAMAVAPPTGAPPPPTVPQGGSGIITRKIGVDKIGIPGENSFNETTKLMKDLIRRNFVPD